MFRKVIKIAVSGAAGQIGYSLLFRLAAAKLFEPDCRIELSLLELEPAIAALKGVVMELEDCAFPQLASIKISSDPCEAFADADWALLVGAAPRKAGMERADLLKINASIFLQQGRALAEAARRNCRVLVVGNPCNTNAFIVKESAVGLDPKNIFAMMMLDQNRAAAQIARKAAVAVTEIRRMGIWGNHSTTQFPDFYHATVSGRNVRDIIADDSWFQTHFIETVQNRGADIIKARGMSSAASAANAVVDTMAAILTPTPENDFFSVAQISCGEYGVPEGLIFGYPVRSDGARLAIVPGLTHEIFAEQKIRSTIQELVQERDAVKDVLGNQH